MSIASFKIRSINDFIAIRAARHVFAIICVECGAEECGANYHAVCRVRYVTCPSTPGNMGWGQGRACNYLIAEIYLVPLVAIGCSHLTLSNTWQSATHVDVDAQGPSRGKATPPLQQI